MTNYFRKCIDILKTDGFSVFLIRVWRYICFKVNRLKHPLDQGEVEKWKMLKGKYQGERVFVVGAGPSINKTPLYLLKGEKCFCFNKANLLFERINWRPEFYMVTDDLKFCEILPELKSEILPKVKYSFFPDIHPSNVHFKKRLPSADNILYMDTDTVGYTVDMPKCGINKTVVNPALQVLAYLGFSQIYLLGVDMTFGERKVIKKNKREWVAEKDDDKNHFDPRYDGKGVSYRNPTVEDMLKNFDKGRKFFDSIGVDVYNCTIGGKLESYIRKDLDEILELDEEQKLHLFCDVCGVPMKESFKESFSGIPFLNEGDECDLSEFLSDTKFFEDNFSTLVTNYIAYGPYNEKYFWRSRHL